MAQVGAFMLIQLTHLATERKKRFVVKARDRNGRRVLGGATRRVPEGQP